MQKPSEKIAEIQEKNTQMVKDQEMGWVLAILAYLDEEWEKEHNHEQGTKCNKC